jgi:HSP20 family protein
MLWTDTFTPYSTQFERASFLPAADVTVSDSDLVLTMDVPGLTVDDLEIELVGGYLFVRGERKRPRIAEGARFAHSERMFGRFERQIKLPDGVEADQVTATMDNGVLSLIVPKPQRLIPKTIEIGAGSVAERGTGEALAGGKSSAAGRRPARASRREASPRPPGCGPPTARCTHREPEAVRACTGPSGLKGLFPWMLRAARRLVKTRAVHHALRRGTRPRWCASTRRDCPASACATTSPPPPAHASESSPTATDAANWCSSTRPTPTSAG